MAELLGQHTAATGQPFEPEAVRRIWDLGQGHPWLTCAIAEQIREKAWAEKLFHRTEEHRGKTIHVVGC